MLQSNMETVPRTCQAQRTDSWSSMAAVAYNMNVADGQFADQQSIQDLVEGHRRARGRAAPNEILHAPEFQTMEAAWASIADLVRHTNFGLQHRHQPDRRQQGRGFEDLAKELNLWPTIAGSELFKKLYVAEYDQLRGAPYGALIGLYEFANTPADIPPWLKSIGKIEAAATLPSSASAGPRVLRLRVDV